ncbi:hypothetical protein D3C77_572280 [compost metagenome]
MIRFKNKHIGIGDRFLNLIARIPEIRTNAQLLSAVTESVGDRLCRIMRNPKGLHPQGAKIAGFSCTEKTAVFLRNFAERLLHRSPGLLIRINGKIIFSRHRAQPFNMV